jgi:membrane associated rhomboid family serine protease
MLEDRYYMRRPTFRLAWSATVVLLVVNVAAFILQNVLIYYSTFPVYGWLALSVEGLRHGYVWQLLSYQFMHGGWLHLLLNCWAIYVFGRELEDALGRSRFLVLYFASGVMGGLFQALIGMLLNGVFAAPVVGASAGVFGLVAAFATLYPERPLMLLLFFIIPVNMRAKFLLLFSGLLAGFGILFPTDNIAHAAHLGGMITGVLFARYAAHWHWQWPKLPHIRKPALRSLAKIPRRPAGPWGRSEGNEDEDLPPEEFLSREVDPILDKITAHGIHSLTERERRILEMAREKMVRR